MLLRGLRLDITYNTGLGEGLKAYRRIFEEFHPRVASRYVGTLTTLRPSKFGDDVEGDLAAVEKSVYIMQGPPQHSIDKYVGPRITLYCTPNTHYVRPSGLYSRALGVSFVGS